MCVKIIPEESCTFNKDHGWTELFLYFDYWDFKVFTD